MRMAGKEQPTALEGLREALDTAKAFLTARSNGAAMPAFVKSPL